MMGETNNIQNVTGEYKATAAKVLRELEKTLGKDLDDKEKFMFVHGTAECKLPDKSDGLFQGNYLLETIFAKKHSSFQRKNYFLQLFFLVCS